MRLRVREAYIARLRPAVTTGNKIKFDCLALHQRSNVRCDGAPVKEDIPRSPPSNGQMKP